MKKIYLLSILLGFSYLSFSQADTTIEYASNGKQKIGPHLYDSWNSLGSVQQSESGDVISYVINPVEGDGNLYVEKVDGSLKKAFARGKGAQIHFGEKYVALQVKPYFDTVRQMKLDKVKKDKMPKDSLFIFWLDTDSVRKIENIESFELSEEGDWMAYMSTKDLRPDCPKSKKKKKKKKKNDCEKVESSGHTLTVYNPLRGKKK